MSLHIRIRKWDSRSDNIGWALLIGRAFDLVNKYFYGSLIRHVSRDNSSGDKGTYSIPLR
jgi:hypothetical protein